MFGIFALELQDSSVPGPAIAKKSDDDDDSSRAACQSGARVHKEGNDHPSTVHISHGSFIETPDPQLNSPTSSISLCKNSHDLEFELGCKIQTAGSADQNQTFLTKSKSCIFHLFTCAVLSCACFKSWEGEVHKLCGFTSKLDVSI